MGDSGDPSGLAWSPAFALLDATTLEPRVASAWYRAFARVELGCGRSLRDLARDAIAAGATLRLDDQPVRVGDETRRVTIAIEPLGDAIAITLADATRAARAEARVAELEAELARSVSHASDALDDHERARVHDASTLHRAERARDEAESILAAAVANAPLVLTLIDAEGRFRAYAGERRTTGSARDHVGAKVEDRYAHDPRVAARVRAALAGEEQPPVLYVDGERVFESRLVPLRGEGGTIAGAIGIAVDVTEKKRADEERRRLEDDLRHTQRLGNLGVLAGGIAHDVNNLLTGILGNATIARRDAPRGPVQESLADLVTSAQRAAVLTRQMLAYSGKSEPSRQRIDLSADVREIARLLESSVPKKIALVLDLADDLPPIVAERADVQQVVMNLVLNGAEAIGDRIGTVTVTTRAVEVGDDWGASAPGFPSPAPGRYVALRVRDDGCGMTEEQAKRIFEPFFTSKFRGRGLGLSSVLGIARKLGGGVRVATKLDAFSELEVLFPIAIDRMSDVAPRPPAGRPSGRGTVLVVDDEPLVRAVAGRTLALFGYQVAFAADGRAAIDVLRERRDVAVVLLDLTMPVMSGEETLRALRTIRPDLPVALTSGYDEREAMSRIEDDEDVAFLPKPFTPDKLAETLARLEGRGRSAR